MNNRCTTGWDAAIEMHEACQKKQFSLPYMSTTGFQSHNLLITGIPQERWFWGNRCMAMDEMVIHFGFLFNISFCILGSKLSCASIHLFQAFNQNMLYKGWWGLIYEKKNRYELRLYSYEFLYMWRNKSIDALFRMKPCPMEPWPLLIWRLAFGWSSNFTRTNRFWL